MRGQPIEVHKDETPCPQNDPVTSPCPLVGTGIHEFLDTHLTRAHDALPDNIRGYLHHPFNVAHEQGWLLLENLHDMIHGRDPKNDLATQEETP